MTLEIASFVIGPYQNNTYLIADKQSGSAVVIDPSFECKVVLDHDRQKNWRIQEIWLTHAHFDHYTGAALIASAYQPVLQVRLHADDLELWRSGGNAKNFGHEFDPGPEPSLQFTHGQILTVGDVEMEIRHAPGHTAGHVVIYCLSAEVLFCGDVIFQDSIGRTDLPGADYENLLSSIRTQVLTLPDATRLLSGHGPETTVEREKQFNPFLT